MDEERKYKVIMCGDEEVGKTSLLQRLVSNQFFLRYEPTLGANFLRKRFITKEGHKLKLDLWDIGGSEIFKSARKALYGGVVGAVIVFDVSRRVTFMGVPKWLQELKTDASDLKMMILVGNKIDQEREVTTEEAKSFAKKHGVRFIETSAFRDEKVDELFQILALSLYKKDLDEGAV